MTVSLIISTYNWPEALDLVFKSVLRQSLMPNEIVIADDGSSEQTKNLINSYKKLFSVPLLHVWHKDEGFRRSVILNKAVSLAKSRYIIQIDGDVLLHSKFIKNHINFMRPNAFVHGSRVLLNRKLTNHLLLSRTIKMPLFSICNMNNIFNSIYFSPFSPFFTFFKSSLKGVRGCNLAFSKDDFIKVNGYNEDISGWGREDTELVVRFINNGIQKRKLKMGGILYHLHHESESREMLNKNTEILNSAISDNLTYCRNGCDKYL